MNRAERMFYLIRSLVGNDPFECAFIKRGDGSLREMHCTLRSALSDDPHNELLAVYDVVKRSDRRVPIDSMTFFRVKDVIIRPSVDGNYLSEEDMKRVTLMKWNARCGMSFLKPTVT